MQKLSALKSTAYYFGELSAFHAGHGNDDDAEFWASQAAKTRQQIADHKYAIVRTMRVIEADTYGPARDCSINMLRSALKDAGYSEELARLDKDLDEEWPSDGPFALLLAELEHAEQH